MHLFSYCPDSGIVMMPFSDNEGLISIGETAGQHFAIAASLIAGHTISLCDIVPQYFGIGKKTMIKVLSSWSPD